MEAKTTWMIALIAGLPLFGVSVVAGDAPAGGGMVNNVAPVIESFSHSLAATVSQGVEDTLSGVAKDANEESDVASIRISTSSGPAVTSTLAIVGLPQSKPAATAGWKVWDSGGADGRISFEFVFQYLTIGTYVWQVEVADEQGFVVGANTITVVVGEPIMVASDPVDVDGFAQVGARWGAWTALPGATSVPAMNYLKVTNLGVANQRFTLDFTPTAFAGTLDATRTVAIDGNIQFGWWEDTTPSSTSPAQAGTSWTWTGTATEGQVSPSFTGTGNIIYITYRILSVPTPIMDQGYTGDFDVTAS